MIDSLWNGIAGINSYQNALSVESNNISNVNTVAYKQDSVSFADLLYNQDYGKGSYINDVNKSFNQGGMKATNSAYDMAIDGDGFFIVQDQDNSTYYTRSGNFKMGADGTLQNINGLQVMGSSVSTPSIVSSDPNITKFEDTYTETLGGKIIESDTQVATINAKATNYLLTATNSDISTSGNGYKTAASKIADVELLSENYKSALSLYSTNPVAGTNAIAQVSEVTFPTDKIDENMDYLSIYVDGIKYTQDFDTDSQTTLNKLSDQLSNIKGFTSSVDDKGKLTITSLVPGKNIPIGSAKIDDLQLEVVNTTESQSGTGLAGLNNARDALEKAVVDAGAEFLEMTNSISLTDQAGLNLTSLQLKLDNLGISTEPFGDMIVDDGNLYIRQNNNSFLVGRVETSMFNNNLGLEPKGDNLFSQTEESGEPMVANNSNTISNNMLELSNADVGEGLVNLMVYQRAFEANSKSITTSDELLQTAIGLKK